MRKLKYTRLQTPAHGPGISNRDIPTTIPKPSALISAFYITQILKNQCSPTVKHMPAGIPCTTACSFPWPEASKTRCRFPQPNSDNNGIERRATQDEPAPQGGMYVLLPTRQFFCIEPRQETLLTGSMRRQIDVYNSSIANVTKKTLL